MHRLTRLFALTALIVANLAGACPVSARDVPAGDAAISLDVRDLDIYDAVRLLSTQSSANVVVDDSVPHHPVTLRLRHVTFAQGLATLAQANGLEAVEFDGVIYLGATGVMNRRYPSGTTLGTRTALFHIASASPDEVAKELLDALPNGTIVVPDARTASIFISGSAIALANARALIAALDRRSALRYASIPMHFVRAADALKAIAAQVQIGAPQSLTALDQQNELVAAGSSDFIRTVRELVAHVDRPGRQVRYEVRVTDVSPSESSNVGFQFGGIDELGQQHPGSGSTVTTFLQNSLAINATINALVTRGSARILARPSISSLNNVQASLLVGEQYPIVYFDARTGTQQVQFVNVGVNLSVTPTIGTDGAITTDLETDYSQVTGSISSFPIISTRRAQSTLRVRDGETIVIAGLFSDVDSSTLTKVPFLGDIPIVGEIFRNRARTHSRDEVVFLITPHLVSDGETANAGADAGSARVP
jgi:type II secretory pathway component GspD/PulD (secretin)